MKKFSIFLFFIITLFLLISYNFGQLKIYNPSPENVHITITKVETGNKLIELSEANVILLLMMVGIFLVVH